MTTNHVNSKSASNIVHFSTLDEIPQTLLKNAAEVRENAYCPYSKFAVGACLLTEDGATYSGCNIENAAFTVGICAERSAYAKAISEGKQKFKAIAVVAYQKNFLTTPCGACRQFMSEFGNLDIYVAKPELNDVLVSNLEEMLPYNFKQNPDRSF